MSADPARSMAFLDRASGELDKLSGDLAEIERRLEPAEKAYEDWLDVFSAGLWEKHEQEDAKLPGEDLRLRIARTKMPPEILGEYAKCLHSRKRLEGRIRSLKAAVSAQQSILSALKTEMEATR